MLETNFAAGLNTPTVFTHDDLPWTLQSKFAGEFDAHLSAMQTSPEPGKVAAVNYAEVFAKAKVALAAVSTAYAAFGAFVPANYDAIIKTVLTAATAGLNAIPTT